MSGSTGHAASEFEIGRLQKQCATYRAEIERLRALLARYRDETPLGHQPHMIAAEVDAALGRH